MILQSYENSRAKQKKHVCFFFRDEESGLCSLGLSKNFAGYAVAIGHQVIAVASGINAHDCSIAAGTGTGGDALFISYTRCVLKIHTVCTKGTHGVYEMNIGRA